MKTNLGKMPATALLFITVAASGNLLVTPAAADFGRDIACGFVQDAYDLCGATLVFAVCRAGVLKLNADEPLKCPLQTSITDAWNMLPTRTEKAASDLKTTENTKSKDSILTNLKNALVGLKGTSDKTAEIVSDWRTVQPAKVQRKAMGWDGEMIGSEAPGLSLQQHYALEQNRIEEEQREHERAVEEERQRLLAEMADAEERKERERAAIAEPEPQEYQQRQDGWTSFLDGMTEAAHTINAIQGGWGGSSNGYQDNDNDDMKDREGKGLIRVGEGVKICKTDEECSF